MDKVRRNSEKFKPMHNEIIADQNKTTRWWFCLITTYNISNYMQPKNVAAVVGVVICFVWPL